MLFADLKVVVEMKVLRHAAAGREILREIDTNSRRPSSWKYLFEQFRVFPSYF